MGLTKAEYRSRWIMARRQAVAISQQLRSDLATLRAENERLKARGIEGMQYRIEELEAALIAIDLLSSQGFAPALTEIGKIAAAALKETPNDEG